jgi:hypothetical protein
MFQLQFIMNITYLMTLSHEQGQITLKIANLTTYDHEKIL